MKNEHALCAHTPLRHNHRSRLLHSLVGRVGVYGLTALATTACSPSDQRKVLEGTWKAEVFQSLTAESRPFEITFQVKRRWWGSSEIQTDCGRDADWHEIDMLVAHKAPTGTFSGEFATNCSTLSGLSYINGWFVGSAMVGKIVNGRIRRLGGGSTKIFYDVTDRAYLFVAQKVAPKEPAFRAEADR